MPSNAVHFHFSECVRLRLPEELRSIVEKDIEAFRLGAQGPDILFYMKDFKGTPKDRLGEEIHNFFVADEMFRISADYAKKCGSDAVNAFVLGQICHYALDANVHPYIYFREGDAAAYFGKASEKYIHMVFESALDYICIRDYMKLKNPAKYKGYKAVTVSKKAREEIAGYYAEAVAPMFGFTIGKDDFIKGISLMKTAFRLYDDRTGLKFKFFRLIEKAARLPMTITSFMRPRKEDTAADIMNLGRKSYLQHKSSGEQVNYTVEEAGRLALRDALEMLSAYYRFLTKGIVWEPGLFKRNYSGELPAAEPND